MKKLFVILLALSVFFPQKSFSQNTDSISIKSTFLGFQVLQNNEKLNFSQLSEILKSNESAYNQLKSAQTTNVIASIIAGVGGYMIGYPIGTAIGGGTPNWKMAGIGAGLAVISIPIAGISRNKIKKAIGIYNSNPKSTSFFQKSELRFAAIQNGAGLIFKF